MSLLDLSAFSKAIDAFHKACDCANDDKTLLSLSHDFQNTIRAGVIQHFEFTYEIAWKFIKRWLENNLGSSYVDGVSRRELFRLAAESGLIESVDEWMLFHRARNLTSHTYDELIAAEIFHSALKFLEVVTNLFQQLQSKND